MRPADLLFRSAPDELVALLQNTGEMLRPRLACRFLLALGTLKARVLLSVRLGAPALRSTPSTPNTCSWCRANGPSKTPGRESATGSDSLILGESMQQDPRFAEA